MARLVREIEENTFAQPRCLVVSAGALWRESGPTALLNALGREVRPGWELSGLRELTDELLCLLQEQDVVIQVSGLERHAGGPQAFVTDFWSPLVDALPENTDNRMICLAAVETNDELVRPEVLVSGVDPVGDEFRPERPVILPGLRSFTESELSFWLRSRLPAPKAGLLGRRLMEVTEGNPHALYAILADHALWKH
jgi:hypothetical protein